MPQNFVKPRLGTKEPESLAWKKLRAYLNKYVAKFDSDGVTLTLPGTIAQEAWTAPTLLNSWVDFSAGHQAARYRKDKSGVVHIQGLVKSGTTTTNTVIFTLPTGYRPDAQLIFMCGQYNNVYGRIDVASNGDVKLGITGSATWQNITLSFAT